MGWFERFTFWRDDSDHDSAAQVEQVEGFDVDGCFTLPDARLPDLSPAERSEPDC